MGEGQYLYEQWLCDNAGFEDAIWITREGQEIPIARMTTEHIQNALAMLNRNHIVCPFNQLFEDELDRRGIKPK